jgi:hypothetical protein
MNKRALLNQLDKVWFLRDSMHNNQTCLEIFNIKEILETHPQLMHTNFLHASKLMEDTIIDACPDHRILLDIKSTSRHDVAEAFMSAHNKALLLCRKAREIMFDTLTMRDVSGLQGRSSYHYHCTNLAVATQVIKEDYTEAHFNWEYGLKNGLSPNDFLQYLITSNTAKVDNSKIIA